MIGIEGGRPLRGTVRAAGAKNAALPAVMASLLTTEPVVLENVPHLLDVDAAVALAQAVGKEVTWQDSVILLRGGDELAPEAPAELVQRMRASFLALGPILARTGESRMPLPGGCAIGPRPVDLHLVGLRQLGATFDVRGGMVHAHAPRLRGTTVYLDYPSVGATEQLLLAGALAHGTTTVVNPAREPEVVDLGWLLSAMGAEVTWHEDRVTVWGQRTLGGATHRVIPDRIEAGTYLLAGAITRGEVTVEGARPDHLDALLAKLSEAGARVETNGDRITVGVEGRPEAVNVQTLPYPGFPTDLQPPLIAFLATARGRSTARETVFASRFNYVGALAQMGAQVQVSGDTVLTDGVETLHGAEVEATDIRAGAALILAALAADERTAIRGEMHIARGYADLPAKLRGLGAEVWATG
ncbi:UDP-N-acetylglucosamine 1-carboxyvinyltransferase 2 [Candidatus Bipolaricaulis anaerobius]|uniref:UDP-N-acetylglucosamine 1-carboxyvinyltransferase n=1 Tax=Candidatus Bipolaricaulis anaerobius TaxID=2026885 RepID=A0A2X3L0P8_9BACT|nr:UDP-N-acetylglucosamine 1-carboxyvinyltransferase [Candidatus Bipolaricaulis anaerobius]SQD92769.1 UDP-N-acetylglucosamine 1-carboxyvinyltransferase 2 [Candidatus Bipolaricaulis anaerobius]